MDQETLEKIISKLEEISCPDDSNIKIRLVDVLPSNGYVRKVFLRKHSKSKYAEGKTHDFKKVLLQGQFNLSHDLFYFEVPLDYTYSQHEELAKVLQSFQYNWVLYSPIAEYIKDYYSWSKRDGVLFYNKVS